MKKGFLKLTMLFVLLVSTTGCTQKMSTYTGGALGAGAGLLVGNGLNLE